MTWKIMISPLAITRRRRVIATALLYGLSLSVRFTSATGEEVQLPPATVQEAAATFSALTSRGTRRAVAGVAALLAYAGLILVLVLEPAVVFRG